MPPFRLAALVAAACLASNAAMADGHSEPLVDSVVIGALAHNLHDEGASGVDPNLEIRFNLPLGFLPDPVSLMPTVGGTLNFDDGANVGYAGATLQYQHESGIYAEGFFGFAIHDADTPVDPDEADLGCKAQFREAAELGYAWQQHQIGVHIAHVSHGGILCDDDENDGLTMLGLRYGYRF